MEPRFVTLTRLDNGLTVFYNIDAIIAFLPEGEEATIWISDGDRFKIKRSELQMLMEIVWR